MIVVDTSAFLALLDDTDPHHARALGSMRELDEEDELPAVCAYAASESLSLVSRRFGMEPARRLQRRLLGACDLLVVSPLEHAAAVEAFLASGRSLSFVDCATMAVMRSRDLTRIFAFDEDFARAGFDVVPG